MSARVEPLQQEVREESHRDHVRITFARVVASEWTKVRSLRSTAWSLIVMVILIVGLGALFPALQVAHWSSLKPAERAAFDPTAASLAGVFLAQLAVAVFGVLLISGEYATGQIRSTFAAVPRRLPVLWAKALVFTVMIALIGIVSSVVAFLIAQSELTAVHVQVALSAPGVARAVVGAGIYLVLVGLLGLALAALLRSTAAAISSVVGLLLILPVIANFLPGTWSTTVSKYLPSNAGHALWSVTQAPGGLSPLAGFGVFCLYIVVAFAAAAVVLRRRDA